MKKFLLNLFTFVVFSILSISLQAQKALTFDGFDDVVICKKSTHFNFHGKMTIEVKIKQAGKQLYPSYAGNFEDSSSFWRGYWLGGDSSGHASFYLGDTSSTASGFWVTGKTYIADNMWHHIAGTFDGDTARLYIDGKLDKALHAPKGFTYSSEDFYIGNDALDQTFKGSIDDVRLWKTARTGAQIKQFKDSCLTGKEPFLSAFYHFEEGKGSKVIDLTGNNNHGKLTNMDTVNAWTAGILCIPKVPNSTRDKNLILSSIFPNPGNGSINFNLPLGQKYVVSVINSSGKKVFYSDNITTGDLIQIKDNSGVYYVSLSTEDSVQHFKYILNK